MRSEQITAKALERLDDDRYKLSLVVAKRAEQLASGEKPLIKADTDKVKLTDIALREVAEGKIDLEALIEIQ